MRWHKGQQLCVIVAGYSVDAQPLPGSVEVTESRNKGLHLIRAGGRYDSHLLAASLDTINKSLEEVENALAALASEKTRNETLRKAEQANRLTVELAESRYKSGLTAFLGMLTAQRSLYAAQLSLSQSQAALTTGYIALYKALGGGWQRAHAP
jgi:hypothetical protein